LEKNCAPYRRRSGARDSDGALFSPARAVRPRREVGNGSDGDQAADAEGVASDGGRGLSRIRQASILTGADVHILGISCYFHDAAAAILRDGELIAAAEEERFTRRKHDYGFPQHAIEFCLESAGIRSNELDYVAFFEKPFVKFERLLLTTLQQFPRSSSVFREAMIAWLGDKLWIKNLIQKRLGVAESRILFSQHHLSHAA